MNQPFLLPPPFRLSQALDGAIEGGGGAVVPLTRRKFLKRSGSATVAAFVAWNITANSARAEEEEGVGGSSYLMRINNIEPESGSASQIKDQTVAIGGATIDIRLVIDVFSSSASGPTLSFPESAKSMSVAYTAVASLGIANGTGGYDVVAEIERNFLGECGLVSITGPELKASVAKEILLDNDGMVLPPLDLDEISIPINGSIFTFSINYDYPNLEEFPNVTYVEAFAKLQGVGVNVSTDEKVVTHTFESFQVDND